MEKIHNLYIISINKQGTDTNYNYNLYFSNYGIVIGQDEDAYLNIKTFQTLNSFYNINEDSKSFTIKYLYNNGGNVYQTFNIDTGNYDIYNFMNAVNYFCSPFFSMEYNEKKNKWNYKKNLNIIDKIFLIPNKYNASYFGLIADYENEILTPINNIGTYSNIINMNNFSLIIIKIIGLIEENKNIDNFNSICKGDIAAIVNRQDVAVNALINWTDINNSFIKKINNIEINSLNFKFTNEMGEELKDIGEWLLTLQIIIKKK